MVGAAAIAVVMAAGNAAAVNRPDYSKYFLKAVAVSDRFLFHHGYISFGRRTT
jgi:hypothetical protein